MNWMIHFYAGDRVLQARVWEKTLTEKRGKLVPELDFESEAKPSRPPAPVRPAKPTRGPTVQVYLRYK